MSIYVIVLMLIKVLLHPLHGYIRSI